MKDHSPAWGCCSLVLLHNSRRENTENSNTGHSFSASLSITPRWGDNDDRLNETLSKLVSCPKMNSALQGSCFMNCHPLGRAFRNAAVLDSFLLLWVTRPLTPVSTPIKLTGSPSWMSAVCLHWSAAGSLSGVSGHWFTSPQGQWHTVTGTSDWPSLASFPHPTVLFMIFCPVFLLCLCAPLWGWATLHLFQSYMVHTMLKIGKWVSLSTHVCCLFNMLLLIDKEPWHFISICHWL